ncbi:iron-only hydrogenase maturation protein HydF [Bacteroides luti]|uniref:Iron-only hydrogenase maturation protein HydF n=1 Tax=Bacteroides luti TaxID=1297750 RepID=A0A1M5BAG9_9BACE|nr:[FeFe] hydrogenase H-cluster maturation GTPase HydF [Bacteroides luti]SHF39499.1 iron-only hydrogenase maturation protein HydF [Bacteroides luti]
MARDLKPHIGIFGRRNVGKSSFINALTGLDVAIVSEVPGTTTDPVKKSMEILGVGPAIIIDTAGIDDSGVLGEKRIAKTLDVIKQIDCAILLITDNTFGEFEETLIRKFYKADVDCLIVYNKVDLEPLLNSTIKEIQQYTNAPIVEFSAKTNFNINCVIETLKSIIPETAYQKPSLLKGLINRGDIVLLITSNDSEAPEGRLILPQVMAIRDVLDNGAINIVVNVTELELFLHNTGIKPKLIITDSQVFKTVNKIVPPDIPLTGFSVAYAHMRGPFDDYVKGAGKISDLKDGDHILILESCTHQVSCDDIGRFKIPNWLREYTKKQLDFDVVAGLDEIKNPITDYALVIQCGSCMITRKQVFSRLAEAIEAGVPVTNYGLTIAWINGIFERAIAPFMS